MLAELTSCRGCSTISRLNSQVAGGAAPRSHLNHKLPPNAASCSELNLQVAGSAAVDLVHVGHQLDALAEDEEQDHQDQHAVHVFLLTVRTYEQIKPYTLLEKCWSCSEEAQKP
jgi:hypothetical protein